MCGRFSLHQTPASLQKWYQAISMSNFESRYNITPTQQIVTIRNSNEGRTGSLMRWGLIPSWAKDVSALPLLHNARGETIGDKPMFRTGFRRKRCLIPASGFYEWKAVRDQKSKQPFYVSAKDGAPFSFAGIWESTRVNGNETIDTCTIITTSANEMLTPIHHRMPVILEREDWDMWLSIAPVETDQLTTLIKPAEPDQMQVWGVSHAVNKVKSDQPELILPITLGNMNLDEDGL